MDKRVKLIKIASWLGISGNALLGILKIAIGFQSGSMAVVGDGIDSSTDVIGSVITLFAAAIITKPPDMEHPYGHGRAETVSTTVLSFIIFFAGAQLFISALLKLISGEKTAIPSNLAVYVILISIAGKILLSFSQFSLGKKAKSEMLIANGKNMRNDVIISLGVLGGLGCTILLNLPVIDSIFALLIGLWIMKTSIEIFISTNTELMEGIKDSAIYGQIFRAVEETEGANNPHRARVRKLANFYVIDIDIEVAGNLTVTEGHAIAMKVEDNINRVIDSVYDIVVHVEPLGNIEYREKFGVSKDDRPKE
ncbi:MAG: cation transporter [bacterium]|nr:cation transporter [bacterium]